MTEEYYNFVIDMNNKTDDEIEKLDKLLELLGYEFHVEHD